MLFLKPKCPKSVNVIRKHLSNDKLYALSFRLEILNSPAGKYLQFPVSIKLISVTMFFLIGFLLPASAFGISIGDRIKATANLNVRSCPLTACSLITTESAGSTGTISNGPYSGSGYTWWYINWDNGYTGYSVQDYLAVIPGSFTLSGNAYCNTTPPVAPAVNLTWGAASGATSYDLYRNGWLYSSGITITSFDNNANVTAGQTYTYYVIAKNANGSTQSNTITVSVPSNICASTQPPTATTGSANSITSTSATINGTVNPNG